jgi:histone-lysine N-methyltransferase SETD3
MKIIAEDQDEPLPLNWAIIVEEWDNTYWIVWSLLLWMLWIRDGDDFEIEHLDLYGWLSDWYGYVSVPA